MDIQLKRGLLDVCVLAAIKDEDGYGYQIIKDIHPYVEISESTLYPVLRRLQKEKLCMTYDEPYQGRNRRYYSITDAGRSQLREYQMQWQDYKSAIDTFLGDGGNAADSSGGGDMSGSEDKADGGGEHE